jgi:hypothetical protein
MVKTKSFKFDTIQDAEIQQWIEQLDREGRDFSKSLRNLIKTAIKGVDSIDGGHNAPGLH